jgi:L-malate glycosyltransferase
MSAAAVAIHQFLPTWEPGAIGAHALALHEVCAAEGISMTTWASEIKPGIAAIARPAEEFFALNDTRERSILLYHSAVGAPMGDQLLARSEPLVLDHHNVTPPAFFDVWHPAMAENLEVGEAQVKQLARRAAFGIADSTFNAEQLQRFGCAKTAVAPVFIDLTKPVDAALLPQLVASSRGAKWLFVGRVAPNKAQHDIVRAFAWYRNAYDAEAMLWLVGAGPSDAYAASLDRLIDRLCIGDAVVLTGAVSEAALGAYYTAADVFVSMSSHEGFGVPLVEAMSFGVPVVAFDASAVGETVRDAGILVDQCDPALFAGCVARVLRDEPLRHELVARGTARVRDFSREAVTVKWLELLAGLRNLTE